MNKVTIAVMDWLTTAVFGLAAEKQRYTSYTYFRVNLGVELSMLKQSWCARSGPGAAPAQLATLSLPV